ncbi:MAG: hypothetical protein U1F71_01555 [Verrucomicrobiaceae bacterium]
MNAPLAFLIRHADDTAPIPREWVNASDWFVIFTLGTLLFLLGAFAAWAWILWRRSSRPQPHIRLLMELDDEMERDRHAAASHAAPEPRAPWEQPADWWKQTEDSGKHE